MDKILIEVCCGSAEDALMAEKGGADRIELNSDLFHGGLTPSVGELMVAKEAIHLPMIAMVRPRAGGFCYTDMEFRTAMADAEALMKYGADGLVFGFLKADGTLDETRCREMMSLLNGKPAVFHRAIDVVPDWRATLDALIDMKVTRVLTSGQEPDVFWGMDTVKEMIAYAAGRIEILPGAGINHRNVRKLVEYTGCTQVHILKQKIYRDESTKNNSNIYYGGALYPPEAEYGIIDSDYVGQVRGLLN